ncbi:hypothetical protein LTR67_005052 [Exophiala xenobiotica]
MVVLTCDLGLHGHHLFAVNISEEFNPPSRTTQTTRRRSRILLWTPLLSTTKLFVRHNDKYLVLGTHTAIGDDGHHEWLLQRFDLVTSKPLTREPLQLRKFYGAEIGSTVCFTIHEGMFYALTNQTSFESEEVDWTSYYHFISFPIDELNPDIKIRMIWRRQHLEGPINDAWADIGFQVDCRSGELLVVECRKEWVDGGSRSIRTYYSQPFERAEYVDIDDGTRMRAPPDDPLSRTLDDKSKSSYERAHVRIARYVHSEFERGGDGDGENGNGNGNRNVKEYIRAKTKWNGYDFNKQCFVDLVSEEVRDEGSWKARERVRVRVVSRHEVSPLVVDEGAGAGSGASPSASANATAAGAGGGMASVKKKEKEKERYMMVRPRVKNEKGIELRDGEEKYSSSSIFLWPRDTPGEDVDVDGQLLRDRGLDDILCPGGRAGEVKAVLGDEGIVYLAGPPAEASRGGERALVFVCFDPTFGFDGMRRVDGTMAVARKKEGEEDQQGEGDEAASHTQRKRKTETEIGSCSGSGQLNTMRHQDQGGLVVPRTTWTPLKAESESGSESCDVGPGLGLGLVFGLGLTGASLQHRHQHQHQTAGMWSNEDKVEPRAAEAQAQAQAQAQARTRTRTRLDAGSGSGFGSGSAAAAASGHLTPQNSYTSLDVGGLQAPQGQGPALYLGISTPTPTQATMPATMLEKTTMSWPPSPPLALPPPLQSALPTMIPDAKPSPPLPLPPSSQGAMLIPDAKLPPPQPGPGPESTERQQQQQQQLATLISPDGDGDGDTDTSGVGVGASASVQDGSGAQTKMEQKPNPKPKQLTYREKAPYISIGRGYWLR